MDLLLRRVSRAKVRVQEGKNSATDERAMIADVPQLWLEEARLVRHLAEQPAHAAAVRRRGGIVDK